MKVLILNTLAAANAAEVILRKTAGLPVDGSGVVGEPVGGGGHAPAAVTRTVRFADILKHPTESKWAVLVRDRDVTRLMSAKAEAFLTSPTTAASGEVLPARLTQAEYDTLKTRLAGAVDIPDGWRPQLAR